jgi:hypothetical protein
MQLRARIRAQPDNVAGVRRDLRLIENHVEHEDGKCITAALVFTEVGRRTGKTHKPVAHFTITALLDIVILSAQMSPCS